MPPVTRVPGSLSLVIPRHSPALHTGGAPAPSLHKYSNSLYPGSWRPYVGEVRRHTYAGPIGLTRLARRHTYAVHNCQSWPFPSCPFKLPADGSPHAAWIIYCLPKRLPAFSTFIASLHLGPLSPFPWWFPRLTRPYAQAGCQHQGPHVQQPVYMYVPRIVEALRWERSGDTLTRDL